MNGSPWIVLPSASDSFDADRTYGSDSSSSRSEIVSRCGVRNLDADGGLAGQPIDEHRFGLHRQAEVVGEAGDLAVLHARVGLELVGGDDRARVDLHDRALDRELAALLLEVPRAVHQLALVDLALGPRRIEQRQRRQGEAAELPLDRRARRRRRPRRPSGSGGVTTRARSRSRGGGCRLWPAPARRRGRAGSRGLRVLSTGRSASSSSGFTPLFLACFAMTSCRCLSRRRFSRHSRTPAISVAVRRRALPRSANAEHAAERELRCQDHRHEQQRQQDNQRARAVEVSRRKLRDQLADRRRRRETRVRRARDSRSRAPAGR